MGEVKHDIEKIEQLAAEELQAANEKYPLFHSRHEAYAVIKEEIEESIDEMKKVAVLFEDMWDFVKQDEIFETDNAAAGIRDSAIRAVQELLQVIAMCDKYNMSFTK